MINVLHIQVRVCLVFLLFCTWQAGFVTARSYILDLSNNLEEENDQYVSVYDNREEYESPSMLMSENEPVRVRRPINYAASTSLAAASKEQVPTGSGNVQKQKIATRNKYAQVNYLTLCHFKICNMGRKRTIRNV